MVVASGASVNSGTLGIIALLSLPPLPAIITEWLALLPLICHLTNYEEDHQMVGELALKGRLTTGLFPKLGYLNGIWRFLNHGQDFLDRANIRSEYSFKVWDASWGSNFTCANGTASSIVTEYALSHHRDIHNACGNASRFTTSEQALNSGAPSLASPPDSPSSSNSGLPSSTSRQGNGSSIPPLPHFQRQQLLHVVRLYRKVQVSSFEARIFHAVFRIGVGTVYGLCLTGMTALLLFLGAYGTAIVLLISLMSKAVCLVFRIPRPAGYLESNERQDACMLSASHDNASTWYLYMGDRGVVDWLLNKNMLSVPSGNGASLKLFALYFRFAHILQLLAMSYVAAQKGIDGVSLVFLMLGNYATKLLSGKHQMARQWLKREGVGIESRTFMFTGRTPMVGCVHSLSEAKDATWMDALISPSKRRDSWIEELKERDEIEGCDWQKPVLNPSDCRWVSLNFKLTKIALETVRHHFPQETR